MTVVIGPRYFFFPSKGARGSLTFDPSTGEFRYNPGPGFEGQNKFIYRVSDGHSFSLPATINIIQWEAYPGTIGYYAGDDAYYLGGIRTYDQDFGYEILTPPMHGQITEVPLAGTQDYHLSYSGDGSHRVPPDVPLENYLHYCDRARRTWGGGVNLRPMPALTAAS